MKRNIENKNFAKRNNHILKKICIVLGILVFISGIVCLSIFLYKESSKNRITVKTIKESWNTYDYQKVYEQGKIFLKDNPYNNTVLAYYGYSCYFLAVAQNDTSIAQDYLEESINSMRLALYDASQSLLPQIQYMLGKAYFYKNNFSPNYYADLVVKYLTLAKNNGYNADDISYYLGLSYAYLDKTYESIAAFTEALVVRESDFLLLSIAEQYFKVGEFNASQQYLYRVINSSNNDDIIIKGKLLLAQIYFNNEDYENSLIEYNEVLEKNENSADAHYGIGLIYEKQNNIVKARSEWRKATKIQPNHVESLKKLSE